MNRLILTMGLVLLIGDITFAGEPPTVLAAGDWSKPVADSRGRALRARLVLCESLRGDRRETPLYLEVQDASDARGNDIQFYLNSELAFRPGEHGGVTCQLKDADGQSVKSLPSARSGGKPKSRWITLPSDATIRLRISPYGIGGESGTALTTVSGSNWMIAAEEKQEYFLSGTFIAEAFDPPDKAAGKEHIWSGTIELPALRIAPPSK